MKSFAEAFFSSFGARIQQQADEWVIDLPTDLAEKFGKTRLYLVFPQPRRQIRELSPAEDLLVYGSRTFDRMLALLENRGEAACLQLPGQTAVADAETLPIPLHNLRLRHRQVEVVHESYYIFNFRVVYVSDEKQEAVTTIILDARGQPLPAPVDYLAGTDLIHAPDHPPTIAPETLRRLFSQAAELASEQAETQAAPLEEAVQPRLAKAILRLTTYYYRLMDEAHPEDNNSNANKGLRAELQQDLTRKIADELERHRLRITIRPLSYAIVMAPFANYKATLASRHSEHTLTLRQDLHTGQTDPLNCHHCANPVDRLALCDRGHIVHAHCLDTCHRCDRDICRSCGLKACALCGSLTCAACIAACGYCERWLCIDHIKPCAICENSHCPEHASRCRWCGQTYCHRCVVNSECASCRLALAGPASSLPPAVTVSGLEPDLYHWARSENKGYRIYIGQRRGLIAVLRDRPIIVTDMAGQVVYWQKKGGLRRLLRR